MIVLSCFVIQVNMLRERNKQYGTIKFVDISSADYLPEDNQGLDYQTVYVFNLRVLEDTWVWWMLAECSFISQVMGRIHAILADGTVVTDVEVWAGFIVCLHLLDDEVKLWVIKMILSSAGI